MGFFDKVLDRMGLQRKPVAVVVPDAEYVPHPVPHYFQGEEGNRPRAERLNRIARGSIAPALQFAEEVRRYEREAASRDESAMLLSIARSESAIASAEKPKLADGSQPFETIDPRTLR